MNLIKLLKRGEYRNYRSSHGKRSLRKGVLRSFAKFTGKHLTQRTFLRRYSSTEVFSYEFWKISKNTFFTEQLWATASETTMKFSRLKSISSIEDDYSFTLVIYLFQVFFTIKKGNYHPLLGKRSLKLDLKKSEL